MKDNVKRDKSGQIVPRFETSDQLLEAQRKAKEAAVRMGYFKHLAKIV